MACNRNLNLLLLGFFGLAFTLTLVACKGEDVSTLEKTDKKIVLPIYQYYKKIPLIRGVTNDPENEIFNLLIEIGYNVGDVRTLQKLNDFSTKIAGKIRQSMASKSKYYLNNLDNFEEIELDILKLINRIIAANPKDSYRVKDIIIIELFLHDYR